MEGDSSDDDAPPQSLLQETPQSPSAYTQPPPHLVSPTTFPATFPPSRQLTFPPNLPHHHQQPHLPDQYEYEPPSSLLSEVPPISQTLPFQHQQQQQQPYSSAFTGGLITNPTPVPTYSAHQPSINQPPVHIQDIPSDSDEDVPNSLYIEMSPLLPQSSNKQNANFTGPSPPRRNLNNNTPKSPLKYNSPPSAISSKDLAFQSLIGTENLDIYFQRVYAYFIGKGLLPILLSKVANLLILAFIVSFSTFLTYCVDHPLIKQKERLSDVIIPQCMSTLSFFPTTFLMVFSVWWVWQLSRVFIDYPRLIEIKEFYNVGLDIQDMDLNIISWSHVVNQIIKLRNTVAIVGPISSNNPPIKNPAVEKIDAHNIANRILRKENYMIAIFNKDILQLNFPMFGTRQMLTRIMEWNLWFCIVSFVFDKSGSIKKSFLRESNRAKLSTELKKRFRLMSFLNLCFSPFLLAIFLLYYFFRYAEEFRKDPGSIGARQYSPLAWWKFREFNELPHIYEARLNKSFPKAHIYLKQFKKEHIIILARFFAFISGSFAVILTILSVVDQGLLVRFEITEGGSVLFYIGLFGGIYAACRSLIPEEVHHVMEPEKLLREVIEETHYLPEEWKGKLNSEEVRNQFSQKFQYKVVLFLYELTSVVFAPFILWVSLPQSSDAVIDFFREFTIHVDSLGYVCSFAVFDFKRHGNIKYGAPSEVQNDYYISKEGKMEQSFINFKIANPDWQPDAEGNNYLSNVISKRNENSRMFDERGKRPLQNDRSYLQNYSSIGTSANQLSPRRMGESSLQNSLNQSQVEEGGNGLFGLLDLLFQNVQ